MRRQRLVAGLVPGLVPVLVLMLSGCGAGGGGTVAAQARADDGKGYIAGDGTVQRIPPGERRTTITVSGITLGGEPLDSGTYRGKVVVINTWGSWCPPCNVEAPILQQAWTELKDRDVQFVGVNVREGPQAGRAFERRFAITYPSLAWDGGQVLVQLKGKATATPTTLVLDRQGRLAGRISGKTDRATLTGLVESVLAQASTAQATPGPP